MHDTLIFYQRISQLVVGVFVRIIAHLLLIVDYFWFTEYIYLNFVIFYRNNHII